MERLYKSEWVECGRAPGLLAETKAKRQQLAAAAALADEERPSPIREELVLEKCSTLDSIEAPDLATRGTVQPEFSMVSEEGEASPE